MHVLAATLLLALGAQAPAAPDAGAAPTPGEAHFERAERILEDEDNTPANIDRALQALDDALAAGLTPARRAEAHAEKAMALLRAGDLARDKDKARGLALYQAGKREADKGIAADPQCANAHFYRGSNLGRWAETRGLFQSMFALTDIKAAFARTLQLQPQHLEAQLARAVMDDRLPGFAGGDSQRAERTYRALLQKYPHYTRAMLDFAEYLENDGRRAEALKWAAAARDERAPLRPGDWRRFDRPRAEDMLRTWQQR
ncbi:MAG: hypothetical protein HY904_10650 [Deltaproteobacteria bacterium]|nr:hypothetical protein [Deltaproteobacteria bacterium]